MVMVQATLATELQNMVPADNEPDAITALVDAYGTFASAAAAGPAVILPVNVTAGKAAMSAALVGMSAPGAGIASIPASIIAFWAAAVVPPWPPAIAGVPPPNAGLAALLAATFPANMAGDLSLADATAAIAANMYAQAIIGGIMTLPPSVPTPIL